MSLWRQLTHGLRSLTNRAVADQDVADEVQQYFDEATAVLMASGLSAKDAKRVARLEMGRLGNMSVVQEQVRTYGWENSMRTFVADLRYAARQLCKNPGFSIVSILTLAVGIGASTAIFSAVNPILFEPLPYPHAKRIMMIWSTSQGIRSEVAFGTFRELEERSRSFETMAVFEPWQPALTGGIQAERLDGQHVSATYFRVLGINPTLGRDFLTSEDVLHGPKVVILSDKLWRQHFNGDRSIVGREVKLDGDNYTVIGVMPHSFENVLSPSSEIWTPVQYDTSQIATNFDSGEWGNHMHMAGRIKPGISRAQAIRELDQIARTPLVDFPRPPWAALRHGLIVDSLQDDITVGVRPALIAVLGAVTLALLIACVNVINLLLARSLQRRREFAIRAGLGASRSRIVRQLITESLLLASLGGALGIGVGIAGVQALIALSPPGLPRVDAIGFNSTVFAFALGITTTIGLMTGLVPAMHVSRDQLHFDLKQSSRSTASGHSWTQGALVITEVALAIILLVSTGLLLRSMHRLLSVDPGFSTSHLLTMQVQTSGHQFDDLSSAPGVGDRTRRRFFEEALQAVRQVPGIERAAFTSLLPLSDDPAWESTYGARFENDGPQSAHNVFRYAVSSDFCETMVIPLLKGRYLDEHDTASAPQVALISESLARRQFPGQDAVGKRLHIGPLNRPWYTVVGVVGNVKQTSLAVDQPDAVYIPTAQTWFADDTLSLVARTHGEASSFASAVESAIRLVDKNQPIVRVATMGNLLAASEAERHFVLVLFEVFGIVALALAAVGIYGVLSVSVAERTREIGVRAALGASRGNILALVLGQGMRLTALGAAIGLFGAAVASRALLTLLFGVRQLDMITYLGVIVLLGIVSAIACWTPAYRAARVDPSVALRAD
jgi:putative ABC transport system permease protein